MTRTTHRGLISVLIFATYIAGALLFGGGASQVEHRYVSFDIAPNGKQIVFSSADGDLFSFDLKTSEVRQVTKTDAIETTPSFSPDGNKIAFAARGANEKSRFIFLCSRDGMEVKQLTDTSGVNDFHPSFSPDGSQIVFARAHRNRPNSLGGWTWDDMDVYVMKSDGKQVRRITNEKYYQLAEARFARDGKSILYSALVPVSGERTTIFSVDVNGMDPPKILAKGQPKKYRGGAWASHPALSPDGSQVAFISDRVESFRYDVFVMDVDGANPKPLGVTSVSPYNQRPIFSPDGKSVMFLAGTEHNAGSRAIYSLWQVDIDGKKPRQIADSGLFTNPLRWKPSK